MYELDAEPMAELGAEPMAELGAAATTLDALPDDVLGAVLALVSEAEWASLGATCTALRGERFAGAWREAARRRGLRVPRRPRVPLALALCRALRARDALRRQRHEHLHVLAVGLSGAARKRAALRKDAPGELRRLLRVTESAVRDAGGLDIDYASALGAHRTLLHLASRVGAPRCVRLLLSLGASPSTVDADGFSPLADACYRGNEAVAAMLLEAGASREPRGRDNGVTLDAAGWAERRGNHALAEMVRGWPHTRPSKQRLAAFNRTPAPL